MRLTLLMFTLASGLACAAIAPEEGRTMGEVRVFYLSFDVDTFVPVTPQTIEAQAQCRFVWQAESAHASELRAILGRAGEGAFDERMVRVKALGLGAEPVFVDVDGGVRRGEAERVLSASDRAALRSLLESMADEEGCLE